jgi:hypothetical protein
MDKVGRLPCGREGAADEAGAKRGFYARRVVPRLKALSPTLCGRPWEKPLVGQQSEPPCGSCVLRQGVKFIVGGCLRKKSGQQQAKSCRYFTPAATLNRNHRRGARSYAA